GMPGMGMAPPQRIAQMRAVHAVPGGGYLGRYPAPHLTGLPHFEAGGPAPAPSYYAGGGEVDINQQGGMPMHAQMPVTPSMADHSVPGYAAGGQVHMSMAQRSALPRSDFAVPSKAPGSGSYPMPDRAHAANAKARAAQFGSPAVKAAVAAKAKAKFGMSQGGQVPGDNDADDIMEGTDVQRTMQTRKVPASKSGVQLKRKPEGRAARVARFEKEHGEEEI